MRFILQALWSNISYIVHDLRILGVIRKIQIMDSLQVDDLFRVDLWT